VYKFENLSQEEIQAMLGLGTQEPRAIREAKAEARQEEARSLVRKQLNWRLGEIPEELLSQIQNLSLEQTEALAQALLGFDTVADLEAWLPNN
jgi:predicted transposase YdaD